MKSKVTIDVTSWGKSFIKIEHKNSDDVRDKLIQNFLDRVANTTSGLLRIETVGVGSAGTEYRISPINKRRMKEECESMIKWIDSLSPQEIPEEEN